MFGSIGRPSPVDKPWRLYPCGPVGCDEIAPLAHSYRGRHPSFSRSGLDESGEANSRSRRTLQDTA